tara:strand:- start:2552 stop:3076 length:525 start_codon:yes stop_codon:yes gene_type:complete
MTAKKSTTKKATKKVAKKTTKKERISALEKVGKNLNDKQKRFVHLYAGAEDGKCFGNATLAYFTAYYPEETSKKDAKGDYTPEYKSALTNGIRLIGNDRIQEYRDKLHLEIGFDPETIKKRYAELAGQNKNLPIALSANDRRAKIAGVIKEDVKVDIPQLEELGGAIKQILTKK